MPATERKSPLKTKALDAVQRARDRAAQAKEKAAADTAQLQATVEVETRTLERYADLVNDLEKKTGQFEAFKTWVEKRLAGDEFQQALRSFATTALYGDLRLPEQLVALKLLAEHKAQVLTLLGG